MSRCAAAASLCVAAAISGCTIAPLDPETSAEALARIPDGGCVVDGSGASLQGAGSRVEGAGAAGSVLVLGECPEALRVLTRTPAGSVVCYGDEAWCDRALESQPVPLTVDQIRELTQ